MRIKRFEEACACNLGCFLQLAADLQHIGGAGAGSERQMLYNRGDGQQCERAVQGTERGVTPNSCCGAENIDRKMPPKCDGRDQVRDEYQLLNNLAVQACRGPWRRYNR